MDQEPYRGFDFGQNEFAANPDPRVPCVLLLDVSASMAGPAINELNEGLRQFRDEISADAMAARRVEVSVITFGGDVRLSRDFQTANLFDPPVVSPSGNTPMAEAVMRGISALEARKAIYQANGIAYYRPWLFLITDGAPTDDQAVWRVACEAATRGERESKFTLFAIGTSEADFSKLRELSTQRPPMQLRGLAFRELFRWLSNSLSRVSQSQRGMGIALPPATGSDGWGEVVT